MLDPRAWLVVGAAFVLCMTGSYFAGRHEGKKIERAAQTEAMNKALEAQRQEFQEKLDAQATIAEDARQRQEELERDSATAATAADGLRRARDAAVAAARKCSAASKPGAPAFDAAGMLGRVLEECSDRYRAVAKYADAAANSGRTCVGSYDTLRKEP